MYPELISYPHIGSYSACWLAGFFGAFLLARRLARTAGVQLRHVDNITLILLVVSPLGARWFSRLFYLPNTSFWGSFQLWEGGGLVFYGGVLFGLGSVVVYAWLSRIPLLPWLDLLSPSLMLGLAFGRLGCFLAGCCFGDICVSPAQLAPLQDPLRAYQIHTLPALSGPGMPLAVQFPKTSDAFRQHSRLGILDPDADRSQPVHPVQLYEALLAAALCWVLVRAARRQPGPGQIFCLLLASYAALRFGIEFLRADSRPAYLGLTLSQLISILSALAALVLSLVRQFRWNQAQTKGNSLADPAWIRAREQR